MMKLNEIAVGKHIIGNGNPCFIVAEVGSNHNGSIKKAKELVDIAAAAGADAIKFQTFTGDKLFSKQHPANEIVKKFEFKLEWHREIREYCNKKGITFMTTPFQKDAVDLLEDLDVDAYKIASGDMDYYPLLDYVSNTEKPIILATGMAYMDEVKEAVERIRLGKTKDIAVLHCISNYPPKDEDINLNVIKALKEEFNVPVGFSDHSMGITMPIAAVAMGANIIEKHFTMSRKLEGMDHFYALEPDELKQMVDEIRKIEKAMGSGKKVPVKNEYAERHYARRGIIAASNLKEGQIITEEHLEYVRPVNGIESKYYKEIIGRKVNKDISVDMPIKWEDLM
jgi:sialic acid synthase SpsE